MLEVLRNLVNIGLNGNEKMRKNYLEFLHSGCKDYPLNILKNTGVDITDIDYISGGDATDLI